MTASETSPRLETHRTINILVLALVAIALLFRARWPLLAALVIGILMMLESPLAAILARGWLKLGALLGSFMPRVVLSVVFFVFLTPIAWCFRRGNRALVSHFRDQGKKSYFHELSCNYDRKSFEKTW